MPSNNTEEFKKEKAREYARKYRKENKEKVNQMQRRWRATHKDMASEQRKRKYLNNLQREKEYSKQRFQNKKEYYYQKRREYMVALQEWVNSMKNANGCKICGSLEQLEYHHINPETKIMSIADMVTAMKNKNEILGEIMKCEVLCSPCHRYTHTIIGKPRKNKKVQNNKLDNYT